jgi:PAT family beta-lactamase induction signal transducer AmpG
MEEESAGPRKNPWLFVPPLYFLEGIPYFVVNTASTTFFAALRVPLAEIGHAASLLTLPWTLKPLWSPAVDLVATKRAWTLAMQTLLVAAIASLAFAATRSDVVRWTVVACGVIATTSATHDVAADGFYLLALDPAAQAEFVGIRNACYRLGRIFATGAVTYLAGTLETSARGKAAAWAIAFVAAAAVYAAGLLWCAFALPRPERRRIGAADDGKGRFVEAIVSYFRQPRIAAVLGFVLLYRFGESMLTTMTSPFLLAPAAEGGMALSTREVGIFSGTYGALALIGGGVAGGFWIARVGLRRSLWPMALSMHVPNLLYLWAAYARPGKAELAGVIAAEQLGYGFGFSAYMVFLMRVSQGGRYPTTHYAISTGIMGLSAMAAGYVSGEIAAAIGFTGFFAVVCACAIPSLVPLFFVGVTEETSTRA